MDRRKFLKVCLMAAAAVGLPSTAAAEFVNTILADRKPSVIWLSFMECTGCTETLLRTSHPALDELILDLISLDYHEALSAAAGHQVEAARRQAMEENAGAYILVVEGAIPTADGGIYCKIGGETALDIVQEAAESAGAIVAMGSCASWGGLPSADPNPTGATGAPQVLEGHTVVTIPGCPPNPYNFLGTALQYATFGTLPALDDLARPVFAYGRTVHEDCPRRGHFDAGRFAQSFGDEGHRAGWCLYELGCKGPQTHANCSRQGAGEVANIWPVGIGAPCVGCTEQEILWREPIFSTVPIDQPTPPATYAAVNPDRGSNVSAIATGLTGLVGGAALGAGYMASKKLSAEEDGAKPVSEPAVGGGSDEEV